MTARANVQHHFYPRSPCGERPNANLGRHRGDNNFYPRSPCGERLAGPSGPAFLYNFYPRSPCGERRATKSDQGASNQFLSTLSLRRATKLKPRQTRTDTNFYPRSPCGERHKYHIADRVRAYISIHALLAESDEPTAARNDKNDIFLSTLSLRRATYQG